MLPAPGAPPVYLKNPLVAEQAEAEATVTGEEARVSRVKVLVADGA